jgi:hypothetical protein
MGTVQAVGSGSNFKVSTLLAIAQPGRCRVSAVTPFFYTAYLHRYLSEFDFRFNGREATEGERPHQALKGFEGKRLMYKD